VTDLIRLNEKGLRAYTARGGSKHRRSGSWEGRIGRILNYSKDRSLACVVWHGNRSPDRVPVTLLEPAEGLAERLERPATRGCSADAERQQNPATARIAEVTP